MLLSFAAFHAEVYSLREMLVSWGGKEEEPGGEAGLGGLRVWKMCGPPSWNPRDCGVLSFEIAVACFISNHKRPLPNDGHYFRSDRIGCTLAPAVL